MPKRKHDDEDDEDDEPENPFMNFFKDPSKLFNSKQFKKLFTQIFDQISRNLPPEFQNLSPEDFMKQFMKNKSKFGFPGPIMTGFNINLGPDGKPIFDSFGNIKPTKVSGDPIKNVRDPLVEVNEQDENVIIIAEMPGVTKEDIELKATSYSITISTKDSGGGRKYHKEIDLPAAINSDYAKASYNNGILELTLKKLDEERKNIKID